MNQFGTGSPDRHNDSKGHYVLGGSTISEKRIEEESADFNPSTASRHKEKQGRMSQEFLRSGIRDGIDRKLECDDISNVQKDTSPQTKSRRLTGVDDCEDFEGIDPVDIEDQDNLDGI